MKVRRITSPDRDSYYDSYLVESREGNLLRVVQIHGYGFKVYKLVCFSTISR